MSIWNKVLVGLNIVVAAAFFYFAATALRAQSYWGENVKLHEETLATIAKEKELLIDGDPAAGQPGIRQLHHEVDRLLTYGRVWRNSEPQAVNPQNGAVGVLIQLPAPHRDSAKTQLYVFEESDGQGKGAYLGEFNVAAVGGQQWQLQPARPMTKAELDRLVKSQSNRTRWSLYEVLPTAPIEAAADPAQPKPEQIAAAEGAKPAAAPAKPEIPAFLQKPGVDYHGLFADFYRQRAELNDLITATSNDAQSIETAEASARHYVELVRKDNASIAEDLTSMLAQGKVVADHRGALVAKLDQLDSAVKKTDAANRAGAGEIARLQLEAIRRIDERTNKIAQAARAK